MTPARREWTTHWPLVLAAAAGFSFSSVAPNSIGLFMEPLNREFGWSRTEISGGLAIAAISTIPLSPFFGVLIDRWGSRRLAIPGIALTGLALASLSLANGSVALWLGLWTVYALVALGIKATVWTAAVSGVFSTNRGLALALIMSGAAISQILVPPIVRWLIDSFGWRQAYVWLGVGWGAPVLLLALFFLFDAHDHARKRLAAATSRLAIPNPLVGLSISEAFGNAALWKIGLSSFLTMVFGMAVLVHQVPILSEAGISREKAALLASLAGVAGVAGKLITGWLMDRMHAVRISGLTLAASAVAFTLLLEPFRSPGTIVLAMMIIGYSSGAKLQISAYLTGKYGGLRNFGKIYGVVTSLIALAVAVGPFLASLARDIFGSYAPFLIAGIPGSLLCGVLIFTLGPYPKDQD